VAVRLKGFIDRSVFFLGWLLSPLTPWNDAFINIPFAYLCASLVYRLAHFDFLPMVLVFYWISNILGIVLMVLGGSGIVREAGYWKDTILKTVLTILIYSIILVLLHNFGILKPAPIPIK
jgi:hypothetical protein